MDVDISVSSSGESISPVYIIYGSILAVILNLIPNHSLASHATGTGVYIAA